MALFSNTKAVADAVVEKQYVVITLHLKFFLTFHRKDKDVGRAFAGDFPWPAAIDAAADVYNGVGIAT